MNFISHPCKILGLYVYNIISHNKAILREYSNDIMDPGSVSLKLHFKMNTSRGYD